jgi:hypothetical protein
LAVLFAVVFLAGDVAVLFVAVFLAGDVAVLFVAVFLAVLEELLFFAGVAEEVVFALLRLAGEVDAGLDVVLVAVLFAVPEDDAFFAVPEDAVLFAAGADRAVVFFAAVLEAVVVLAAAVRFAGVDAAVVLADAVFFAVAVFATVAVVTFGSFLAPETNAFSSAPARNFGTAVFFARVRSPVRGLRTIRAGRTAFSKAPNPVIATFSPLTTSRVTVSTTDSSACRAADLFPSKR